jgi:hypothetical protein
MMERMRWGVKPCCHARDPSLRCLDCVSPPQAVAWMIELKKKMKALDDGETVAGEEVGARSVGRLLEVRHHAGVVCSYIDRRALCD